MTVTTKINTLSGPQTVTSNPISGADSRRSAFAIAMRDELASVVATASFQRSPLLTKLLRYLVDQTSRGAGDNLKSYVVAVEGLGRSPDFDAKSDSYPRVQMVRLRKALTTHYSTTGPANELCLYFRPGSYRARLASLAVAYPDLYRPLTARQDREPANDARDAAQPLLSIASAPGVAPERKWFGLGLLAACVLAMIGAAWQFAGGSEGPDRDRATIESPLVALAVSAGDPRDAQLARTISAKLADGLRRSWTTRVTLDADPQAATDAPPSYRIEMQIDRDGSAKPMVFGRLIEVETGTVVSSAAFSSQAIERRFDDIIDRILVHVASPSGVIAARETRKLAADPGGGYPCILKYFAFLKARDPVLKADVATCLAMPAGEPRLQATVLALHSFFVFESQSPQADRAKTLQTAIGYANQAADVDINNPYAQLALARIGYIAEDCQSANHHASLAMTANPYDPMIMLLVATHGVRCGHPDAKAALDRGFQLRSEGDSPARLWMILAAILQGETGRLATLPPSRRPVQGVGVISHHLCETLTAAALGQRDRAVASWANFLAALPDEERRRDDPLRTIILSDALRATTVRYLADRGVVSIAAGQPSRAGNSAPVTTLAPDRRYAASAMLRL